MSDIRLTEERLRHHLDTNQFKREALCVAVLPLLGSYTSVKPRRPKGGPDGRRDIEAIFDGEYIVWGGVGFRNGGGSDREARKEARKKYKSDLKSALKEKNDLSHFVFFTNVDLTPGQITELKQFAEKKGIAHTEVFDLNRLRSTLDSPEGLIARLQYLDIEMSKTDQLGLINKFGDELQNVFTSRIDRVDETLSRMESFLDFQKPITVKYLICELNEGTSKNHIKDQALYFEIEEMSPRKEGTRKVLKHLIFGYPNESDEDLDLSSLAFSWETTSPADGSKQKEIKGAKSAFSRCNTFGQSEYNMTYVYPNGYKTLSALLGLHVRVLATPELAKRITRLQIIANGYDLLEAKPTISDQKETLVVPDELVYPKGFEPTRKELGLNLILPKLTRFFIDTPLKKSDSKFKRSYPQQHE